MKAAIVSDIHGNLKALQTFIKYIDEEKIDVVLNLGDIIGGDEPIKTLRMIMKDKRFINVAGNHDSSLEFLEDELSLHEKIWLKELPSSRVFEIEGKRFLMVHSRLQSNKDIPILFNNGLLMDFLKDYDGQWEYVLFGHTHYPCLLSFYEGKKIINPGSLGLSFDNKITFVVIYIYKEKFDITFKTIDNKF